MLLTVPPDIADIRRVAAWRGALRVGIDLLFKILMQRVQIPARAFAAKPVDGFIGYKAACCFTGRDGDRLADQRAGVH